MTEAKKRNSDLVLYGLPWSWPGWVGAPAGGSPWTDLDLPIRYIVEWVAGAKTVHNLTIDWIGDWNETFGARFPTEFCP
jgi:galactosylceramidase